MKPSLLLIIVACFFCGPGLSFAQTYEEDITLSTYYPAPYGEYDILSANKVGIGMTNPYRPLSIRDYTGNGVPVVSLINKGDAASGQSVINMLTKDTDEDGVYEAGDKGWHITARSDHTGWGEEADDLIFCKYDSGYTEVLRLDFPAGNVGIAMTSSPTRPLEVNGVAKVKACLLTPINTATIPLPVNGMICYDIADNQIKQYNQTTSMWQALGSGGGTAKTWLAIPASIYTHSLTNLGPGYQETDWVTVDNAALDSHPSSFAILRIYCSAFGMAFLRPKGSTAASNWATLVHASDGNYKFTSMAIIPLDANGDFQVNFRALGFAGTQHLYIYLLGFFD